jgi:hypothetical protein
MSFSPWGPASEPASAPFPPGEEQATARRRGATNRPRRLERDMGRNPGETALAGEAGTATRSTIDEDIFVRTIPRAFPVQPRRAR